MAETIYTIPINEVFEKTAQEEKAICPMCELYLKLEKDEIDRVLGAAMMEPDVRIETNKKGFCKTHYKMMFAEPKKLGLALILESHLNELFDGFNKKGIGGATPEKNEKRIEALHSSCYVCDRIERNFSRMLSNTVYMWDKDEEFRKKIDAQKYICLEHYNRLFVSGKNELPKKKFDEYNKQITGVVMNYFDDLRHDVSHFCKKFDYRYEEEPWGNSKDSVERAIAFLKGK